MKRRTKLLLGAGGVLVALLVAAELGGRLVYGLGDEPVIEPHPTVEYLYRADSTYTRRGNTLSFNAHSMRSPDLTPGGRRVLVLGDSVVNGGAQTDQAQLATSLVAAETGAQVMNVSTGSWGPANLLAYVEAFGTFDADEAVVVLSGHDAADVPTFDLERPTGGRGLALAEAGRRLWRKVRPAPPPADAPTLDTPATDPAALEAFDTLLVRLAEAGVPTTLLLHPERDEFDTTPPGHAALAAVAEARGVRVVSLADAYGRPDGLYRDRIHPSVAGQRALADAMLGVLRREPDGAAGGE